MPIEREKTWANHCQVAYDEIENNIKTLKINFEKLSNRMEYIENDVIIDQIKLQEKESNELKLDNISTSSSNINISQSVIMNSNVNANSNNNSNENIKLKRGRSSTFDFTTTNTNITNTTYSSSSNSNSSLMPSSCSQCLSSSISLVSSLNDDVQTIPSLDDKDDLISTFLVFRFSCKHNTFCLIKSE